MASLTRWTWVWVNSESWWWTGRPGMLRFMGSQRVGHNWVTDLTDWTDSQINKYLLKTTRSVSKQSKHIEKGRSPGEGNGSPLQCSCLGNPRDGGARWAAVYGVTQSWTRLKWLSSSSRYLIVLFSPVYSKKLSYFHISITAFPLCFITINS